MKPQRRPVFDINRRPETPIHLNPFDPQIKQQALAYGSELNILLAPLGVTAELFGSLELEITSKGEWEYAIYLTDEQWFPTLVFLINHFHGIHFLSEDMAVFTSLHEGTSIEVIPLRNEAADRNRAIMKYWHNDPDALQAYEQGKIQHSSSTRNYYRWKDEYIAGIVEKL
jgi:hypothetical protein